MPIDLDPSLVSVSSSADDADVRLVGVTTEMLDELGSPFGEQLRKVGGFKAEPGQTLAAADGDTLVVAVGLGAAENVDPGSLRRAVEGAVAGVKVAGQVAVDVVSASGLDRDAAVASAAEGVMLGRYSYSELRSQRDDSDAPDRFVIVADAGDEPVRVGVARAQGVALTRDLVNEPGGSLTPHRLAERASELASDRLEVEVWDKDRLEAERCGGILAVNKGSVHPPRLVWLRYRPAGTETSEEAPTPRVTLVGKGITFDSGGLSIKTGEGMMTMKTDMGGAAAVLGAMSVIAAIGPDVAVDGIICATDNMTGGDAQRPGDVLRARNGKTVEVLNTDAEGRLVLADGLSLAAESDTEIVVDVATLTGACIAALGPDIAGLLTGDDDLAERLLSAASSGGELLWRLPLHPGYRKELDSKVADLRNIGKGRQGGAITAALFLSEFAGDKRWAHLDVAGPVFSESSEGSSSAGATGYGVRTLVELVTGLD